MAKKKVRTLGVARPAVPTVAEYFRQRLGSELELAELGHDTSPEYRNHPASPYHPEFTIETGCGSDCRAAIDAAAEIMLHLANAFGEPGNREHPKGPALRAAVVEATRNIVLCYVYG